MKKEKTKKYYLSGKISGLSEHSYIQNFNKAYSEVLFYDEFDRNKDSIIICNNCKRLNYDTKETIKWKF